MAWGHYSERGGHDSGTYRGERLAAKHPDKPKKTVFNTDMVFHIWAQQKQSYGRNAKASVYFDGPTLYSYGDHFVMARFARPGVVLFNAEKNSVTTSAHQHKAHAAVKDKTTFFVENPTADCADAHDSNLAWYAKRAREAVAVAQSKRYGYRQRLSAVTSARTYAQRAADYQKTFFPRRRKAPIVLPDLGGEIAAAQAAQARRDFTDAQTEYVGARTVRTKHYTAKKLLRAAYECRAHGVPFVLNVVSVLRTYCASNVSIGRRTALGVNETYGGFYGYAEHAVTTALGNYRASCGDYRETTICPPRTHRPRSYKALDDFIAKLKTTAELEAADAQHAAWRAQWEREETAREAKRNEARRLANAAIAEKRDAWRRGLPVNVRESECMLRLDGPDVLTSWGAQFPAEHARKAWPRIKVIYERGAAWRRNGHTIHLGHFEIDSIAADGTLKAGCHTLTKAEIIHCASLLGLTSD